MILNEFSTLWIRSISLLLLLLVIETTSASAQAQSNFLRFVPSAQSYHVLAADSSLGQTEYPDPKKVMHRSLMIPGWGQVTNKQAWKVPIVYGVLGGLGYYSVVLHKQYHDYRAAFYNLNPQTPDDLRFGPTPSYISENASLEALRQNRNYFRNRRDLMYVVLGLSYALNAIDAYVFAHLRSFDVSDDLSMSTEIKPQLMASAHHEAVPSLSISIKF